MMNNEGLTPFVILQSDLSFEAHFGTPAFDVFRDPEGLHRALHEKLSPYGLRLADMKYEPALPIRSPCNGPMHV